MQEEVKTTIIMVIHMATIASTAHLIMTKLRIILLKLVSLWMDSQFMEDTTPTRAKESLLILTTAKVMTMMIMVTITMQIKLPRPMENIHGLNSDLDQPIAGPET